MRSWRQVEAWRKLKDQHPGKVVLLRVGDFCEAFYADAELLAKKLGLTLTTMTSDKGLIPMVGVPYHILDIYTKKLLQSGISVETAEWNP